MLAPTISLGLLMALGLIVLNSVDAVAGVKTVQVSVVPNDVIVVKLVPGASRAVLSIATHVGDGAPYQPAVVNNIWGSHDGKLCFITYRVGESPSVHLAGAIATGSLPQKKNNDTMLTLYGWLPPTISSNILAKKFLIMDRECMDTNWRWQHPQKERNIQLEFASDYVTFLRLEANGPQSKALGVFSTYPGFVTVASGDPGVDIKSVTVHRRDGGAPLVPKKSALPATLATHTMATMAHGTSIKIPFEPQTNNGTLSFSVHNPLAPQMAVIYNIVGHKDGKFCVVSMWSTPWNTNLIDYSKVTHAPWDIAASKPLKGNVPWMPHTIRYVYGCPGWYGRTRVAAVLDTCKNAEGEFTWDRVPQQVELVFRSEANGYRLLLNNQVMPGSFVDGWLPAAADKSYSFCVGPSPGMNVKSISVGNN